jgi:elongation factor G
MLQQIIGNAPLSELMGYSTILRTISSGLGTFSMSFSHYELVNNPSEEQKIMQTVRGF